MHDIYRPQTHITYIHTTNTQHINTRNIHIHRPHAQCTHITDTHTLCFPPHQRKTRITDEFSHKIQMCSTHWGESGVSLSLSLPPPPLFFFLLPFQDRVSLCIPGCFWSTSYIVGCSIVWDCLTYPSIMFKSCSPVIEMTVCLFHFCVSYHQAMVLPSPDWRC